MGSAYLSSAARVAASAGGSVELLPCCVCAPSSDTAAMAASPNTTATRLLFMTFLPLAATLDAEAGCIPVTQHLLPARRCVCFRWEGEYSGPAGGRMTKRPRRLMKRPDSHRRSVHGSAVGRDSRDTTQRRALLSGRGGAAVVRLHGRVARAGATGPPGVAASDLISHPAARRVLGRPRRT